MKIELIKVGKPTHRESKSWVETYVTRTQVLNPIKSFEFKDQESLLRQHKTLFESGNWLVVLDERGKQWRSIELAEHFRKWLENPAIKTVSCVVGGPYGFEDDFKNRSNQLWSLSQGTFPSDLAWVVVAEQIYRAMTILKGMPYHHA